MSKLLAEWFWTDRWSGSDGWLLPLAARGLYREMLTQAWKRGGSLPDDHVAIKALCNVSPADWDILWPTVSPFWKSVDSRLVNETQVTVYAEAKGKHERAQARAQAGAQAKHNRVLKDKPPSPSPSPYNGTGKPETILKTAYRINPLEPPMPNPTPVPEAASGFPGPPKNSPFNSSAGSGNSGASRADTDTESTFNPEPAMPIPPGVRGDEEIDAMNSIWAEMRGGPHRYIHDCLSVVRAIGVENTKATLRSYLRAKDLEKFKGTPSDFAANYLMFRPRKADERPRLETIEQIKARELA